MIEQRETDMRITDLIKHLRKMKREHGNIRIATTWANGEVRVKDKTYPPTVNQLKVLKGRQYRNIWAWVPVTSSDRIFAGDKTSDEVDTSENFCNL